MTSGKFNLKIVAGITFGPLEFACKDSAGEPVSLAGWTAFAEVRRESGELVVNLAPVISDAGAGKIKIEISHGQTAALPLGSYVWDMILQQPSGARIGPYISGAVSISKPVTQPG